MIEEDVRPEDSRAIELSLALDRAGTHEDLSARLRRLPGTDNEGALLAAISRAEAVLELVAEQGSASVVEVEREPVQAIEEPQPEPVETPVELPTEPESEPDEASRGIWFDGQWYRPVAADEADEPPPADE